MNNYLCKLLPGLALLLYCLSPAFALTIQKGPYLQNVTRHSITVCWETDAPAAGTVVYNLLGAAGSLRAESPEKTKHHCAPLKNLKPDTTHQYYVGAGDTRSDIYTFRTAPAPGAPFRFVAYGDSRSHEDKHRAVVDAVIAEKPALVFNTGDVVNKGDVPTDWARFFRGAAPLINHVPYYVAIGNHEKNHPDYFKYFAFPGNERYYSVDYAGVRFIALDTNMPYRMDPKQKAFLKEELKAGRDDITFVFFHHPPYSSGKHGSDEQLRGLFGNLFKKGRVDAVINGHDHHYERAEPADGLVYVVTGGGGAELRDVGRSEWTRASMRAYNYVVVDVKDGKWSAQTKTPDGKIIDTFSGAGP